MTHKQKPKSAEFRAREAQVDEIHDLTARSVCHGRSDFPSDIFRVYLEVHLLEAEARGAAEQRRKDAEGAEPLAWQWFKLIPGTVHWRIVLDSEKPLNADRVTNLTPLYAKPPNVSALEARVKELEGEVEEMRSALAPFAECAECFDASGNDYERDYPDEFSLGGEDDDNVLHCLNAGHLRVARSVYDASIREGGEQ